MNARTRRAVQQFHLLPKAHQQIVLEIARRKACGTPVDIASEQLTGDLMPDVLREFRKCLQ